ncbi:MAG: hypothetical protein IT445_06135 [Phycisphaeraceae bacterium]|nr:hypothetical protein [Phycisphaeraceae bacterium]
MQVQSINGTWQLRHEALIEAGADGLRTVLSRVDGWITATVPGEVHVDLMAAGLMPEPLVSTNAPACRWPEKHSWWYRTSFVVDADVAGEQIKELVFQGLDYYAQIFLNGIMIGASENAFVPAVFDVTHSLCNGKNELVVRLTVGTERARDQRTCERSAENIYASRQSFKGTPELRKPQFSYGWDWVDALPNIGIWRGVELRGYSCARLSDVKHWCTLEEDHALCHVHVEIDLENLHPSAEHTSDARVTLVDPEGVEVCSTTLVTMLPVGITRLRTTLVVAKPQLWWPHTMGRQPLYTLQITATINGVERDTWTRQIGLRTVAIDRSPLPEGHRFALQVNGQDVFCRGGNWVPADAIPARVDREKYERLVADAAEANMTMLRVWGGGIYESEHFYNACDRRGILVWQDFMFACYAYPDEDVQFRDKVRREAEAVVRQLRHHPSIVLWCANNENTWAFAEWWGNAQHNFPHPDLILGGRHIYSQILPEVCLNLDPSRPYWPGSPAGGPSPNCEIDGDVHWWHKATMSKDVTRRYRHEVYDECRGRFVSEYGVIGPCTMASIRQYLKPDEIDKNSLAWKCHTNTYEKGTIPAAIRYHYADPDGLELEQYIRYGQMFQAVMYGRTIEALRFRKHDPMDDCAGALIWMFNDCWGETGWTPIDYYLRRKPSYYWIRNACNPVRAIVRARDGHLVARVVNDSLVDQSMTVHYGWVAVDGSSTEFRSRAVVVPSNSMKEIARDRIPASADRSPHEWIYTVFIEADGIETIPCVWNLCPYRELDLADPTIECVVRGSKITVTSDTYAHGVHYQDDGERILSDNYFDLLPGLPKVIKCAGDVPADLIFHAIDLHGTTKAVDFTAGDAASHSPIKL